MAQKIVSVPPRLPLGNILAIPWPYSPSSLQKPAGSYERHRYSRIDHIKHSYQENTDALSLICETKMLRFSSPL